MISARSIGAKARCEDYEAVDLASFTRKRGDLKPWSARVITFNSGLRIAAYPECWAVTLKVEGNSHRIPLAYTATRFGGRRPWFLCLSCQTHRRLIYLAGVASPAGAASIFAIPRRWRTSFRGRSASRIACGIAWGSRGKLRSRRSRSICSGSDTASLRLLIAHACRGWRLQLRPCCRAKSG